MEPFKNVYSFENARKISRALKRSWPGFPSDAFLKDLESQLKPLELKDRKDLLSKKIGALLPKGFPTKVRILLGALAENENDEIGLRGFPVWPLSSLIAREGLEHFELSMEALKETTRRFTAEFDIRPFLEKEEKKSLRLLKKWAADPDPRVRRLVSEGTRPLLPWGGRLSAFREDPTKTIELLELLKLDEDESVRTSVANHMNDHSKAHGDWVVARLDEWRRRHPDHAGLARVVRHASRSLVKAGHSRALRLHGVSDGSRLEVELLSLSPKRLNLGGDLRFRVRISNPTRKAVSVLADYVIHHRKANGALSPKVFKGRKKTLSPGEEWIFDGTHKIRRITTRAYFSGKHLFALQINGRSGKPRIFHLKT